VVEVNMAPHPTVEAFLHDNRRCYAAAAALGLSPYRLYYNGNVADSGGGGQITLGGPSPRHSPFFLVPQLLPRLVGYFERHPALSYLFAHDYTGPSGHSVRPIPPATAIAPRSTSRSSGIPTCRGAASSGWSSFAPFACSTRPSAPSRWPRFCGRFSQCS
jgi:hypothetical protein